MKRLERGSIQSAERLKAAIVAMNPQVTQICICPKFAIKIQAREPDCTLSTQRRAPMSMETFFIATLRAHFRSNTGLLIKRLHMPDDRRVLDG
jgi:hypothetical protein